MAGLPNVMISYQWDSQKQILKLKEKLKQEGFSVWMDVEKMEAKYAYNKDVPIIPIKVDASFEPSGWLGPLIGTSLYYLIDTDERLNTNFPNLIRAIKGIKRKRPPTSTVAEEPLKAETAEQSHSLPGSAPFKRRQRKALDCSICLDRFKTPKTLIPCLHSYCKDCLLGWVPYGTKTFACPQCRQEASVPDGDVNKLKTNFHLQELVEEEALQEQMTSNESSKFTCTCCEGETQSPAIAKCKECNLYLCETSVEMHQKFPPLRKHIILRFEDQVDAPKSSSASSSETSATMLASESSGELQTTVWEIFDALYNEDHSGNLLKYWMQRQGGSKGWQTKMINRYVSTLNELEEDGVISEDALVKKQEKVARVFMQAGQYREAITLVKKIIETESKELGARPEKLADLYGLISTIHLEISKESDFIVENDENGLSILREVIRYARKSIKLRKSLEGDDSKYKLGKTLVALAFALNAWFEIGGDTVLTTEEAATESKRHAENAIDIFKGLDSKGNLADAIMTKGILFGRGSEEQEKLYMEAYKLCVEAYGECSVLTSRLNINIGILHEDRQDFYEAYKWFVKWGETCEKVFGHHHEKTEKTRRTFEEPRYAAIRKELADSK